MEQQRTWRVAYSRLLAILMLSLTLALAGCGGGGGGSSSSGGGTGGGGTGGGGGTSGTYSGSATLSGSVDLSSLTGSDSNLLNSSSRLKARGLNAVGDENVLLYAVDDNGTLVLVDLTANGITRTFDNSTDSFTFTGLADGVNYVVRYVRILASGQAIEMKVAAEIPEGQTTVTAPDITPITTMIVEAVMTAVADAVSQTGTSAGLSTAVIEDLITTVKTAITTSINALVTAGVIAPPSVVVEVTATTVDELEEVTTVNEDVATGAGVALLDDNVTQVVEAQKVEIQTTTMSSLNNEQLIARIFNEMLGDGDGAPAWMVTLLAQEANTGKTVSIDNASSAILEGIEFDDRLGFSTATINNFRLAAIAAFPNALQKLFDARAKLNDNDNTTNPTEEEREFYRNAPSVIFPLFEDDVAAANGTYTVQALGLNSMTVPQTVAYTIFVVDFFAKKFITNQGFDLKELRTESGGTSAGEAVQVEYDDPFEFNPFHLFALLGLTEDEIIANSEPTLGWFEVRSDMYWNGSTGVETLSFNLCIDDFRAEFDNDSAAELSAATVSVAYRRTDNTTGTVNLFPEEYWGGGACFYYSPWSHEPMEDNSSTNGPSTPEGWTAISDFASGIVDFTVTANVGGQTYEFTVEDRFLLSNVNQFRATLTSPLSYPVWPGENGVQPTQEQMAAYELEMQEFNNAGGITTFAPTTAGADNISGDQLILSWRAPDLSSISLPTWVRVGYQLNIGLTDLDDNGSWENSSWEPIYNTWEDNKIIFATSFRLPSDITLPVTNGEDRYNIGLNLVFVDKRNGNVIAHGGHSWAEFKVGTPMNPTDVVHITGAVESIETLGAFWGASAEDDWKVALVKQTYTSSTGTQSYEMIDVQDIDDTASSDNYSLDITIAQIRNSRSGGGWLGLIMFNDRDGDGTVSQVQTQDNWTYYEQTLWPVGTSFWFDVWGAQIKLVTQECSQDDQGYTNWNDCSYHGQSLSSDLFSGGEYTFEEGPVFDISYYDWMIDQNWTPGEGTGGGTGGTGGDNGTGGMPGGDNGTGGMPGGDNGTGGEPEVNFIALTTLPNTVGITGVIDNASLLQSLTSPLNIVGKLRIYAENGTLTNTYSMPLGSLDNTTEVFISMPVHTYMATVPLGSKGVFEVALYYDVNENGEMDMGEFVHKLGGGEAVHVSQSEYANILVENTNNFAYTNEGGSFNFIDVAFPAEAILAMINGETTGGGTGGNTGGTTPTLSPMYLTLAL